MTTKPDLMAKVITKTYTLLPIPDGRSCCAQVTDESGQDICGATAVVCINITTVSWRGRKVVSRVGFCKAHRRTRYIKWFDLEWIYE